MTKKIIDINRVRKQFPALENNMIFMDNAGGSQILSSVIERISEYLTKYNVQLGASYKTSQQASEKLEQAQASIQNWINADSPEEIIISSSTTLLIRILSLCISQQWQQGDEVIICNCDHEANMAPWRDLQKLGIKIKIWKLNKNSLTLDLNDLKNLMSDKCKLLAMTHVSNILGTINPIKKITQIVHEFNALICVDGVAYAPHRLIDVQDLDVDFYVFSTYKTFGPHQAIMYGKREVLESINGINHPFIHDSPYKFQPGNINYELSYSIAAIPEYLKSIGTNTLQSAYDLIANHEQTLTEKLLNYLNSHPQIIIIGETTADKSQRVSTISFIHNTLNSDIIVKKVDRHNIGIRYGDFYAVQLIEDLGLKSKNGVVRVSLVHYNTLSDVEKLISVFKTIFI